MVKGSKAIGQKAMVGHPKAQATGIKTWPEDVMSDNIFDKEEKVAKKLLKRYPFIKDMWKEREKAFGIAHKNEAAIEKKYNKIAKKAGLKSLKFGNSSALCRE